LIMLIILSTGFELNSEIQKNPFKF
jgi:hypothetical protein